jgi:hypothetical protein
MFELLLFYFVFYTQYPPSNSNLKPMVDFNILSLMEYFDQSLITIDR